MKLIKIEFMLLKMVGAMLMNNHGTTVSAIRCLDDHRFVQFVHHSPNAPKGHHTNEMKQKRYYV